MNILTLEYHKSSGSGQVRIPKVCKITCYFSIQNCSRFEFGLETLCYASRMLFLNFNSQILYFFFFLIITFTSLFLFYFINTIFKIIFSNIDLKIFNMITYAIHLIIIYIVQIFKYIYFLYFYCMNNKR